MKIEQFSEKSASFVLSCTTNLSLTGHICTFHIKFTEICHFLSLNRVFQSTKIFAFHGQTASSTLHNSSVSLNTYRQRPKDYLLRQLWTPSGITVAFQWL